MEHTDHSWYAVRISGQATRVSHRRIIFTGPKGGSHQYLVPDINQKTNIEVELEHQGIEYFLPMSISEAPHRRKRNVMVTRRAPLLPGYVFVQHVPDWQRLEDAEGVVGVLKCGLDNVRIPSRDIHDLRMIEWQAFCDYLDPPEDREKRAVHDRFVEGARYMISHKTYGQIPVTILSITNRNRVKAIADKLGRIDFLPADIDEVNEAA
ncbi:transcription termination/antitermination NusG family protein [Hoeflea alexandrii]|uniref:NusG-like N-terminal domain-containing protein n=1 Tax=Hoeflea alexandrii TaxID=288436 RepID=A0ABT1CME5_9HYPH|nr:transcription termination/antitermination NusG family protein [Hoeflea alexandrii]MCO6407347.1 hypothetical protein [Hoeflea alexandrii]